MTHRSRFIGVDPGPMPGMVELRCLDGRLIGHTVLQVAPPSESVEQFNSLLQARSVDAWSTVVAIERFVVGRRAARSSSATAGEQTRDLVGALTREAARHGVDVILRNASTVKTWATNERLERAGLIAATKGMTHARDAARHALFAAVHAGAIPDPLSKAAAAGGRP